MYNCSYFIWSSDVGPCFGSSLAASKLRSCAISHMTALKLVLLLMTMIYLRRIFSWRWSNQEVLLARPSIVNATSLCNISWGSTATLLVWILAYSNRVRSIFVQCWWTLIAKMLVLWMTTSKGHSKIGTYLANQA